MMEDQITISIDGTRYGGWTEAKITKSLDELAHTFDLSYFDRWDGERWPIRPGNACRIAYGRHPLIEHGYVNYSSYQVGPGASYALRSAGRSATGDLVDSSAIYKSGQWRNVSLSKILDDLVEPFGIKLDILVDEGDPFGKFEIEEGETVADVAARAARLRGGMLYTNRAGYLAIVTTDDPQRSVTLPVSEAISRNLVRTDTDRYSEYTYVGGGHSNDAQRAAALRGVKASVSDPGVLRYRPLVSLTDGPTTPAAAKAEAVFEANRRAGKSGEARYLMPGLLAPDGKPWEPSMAVAVRDPELGLNLDLIVAGVEMTVNNSTMTTDLRLVPAQTYSVLPSPKELKSTRA